MSGPDILSHAEGVYCDLDTHTLYPLCDKKAKNPEPCFDEEVMELVGADGDNEPKTWLQRFGQRLGISKRSANARQVMKKIVSPLDVDEAD